MGLKTLTLLSIFFSANLDERVITVLIQNLLVLSLSSRFFSTNWVHFFLYHFEELQKYYEGLLGLSAAKQRENILRLH